MLDSTELALDVIGKYCKFLFI